MYQEVKILFWVSLTQALSKSWLLMHHVSSIVNVIKWDNITLVNKHCVSRWPTNNGRVWVRHGAHAGVKQSQWGPGEVSADAGNWIGFRLIGHTPGLTHCHWNMDHWQQEETSTVDTGYWNVDDVSVCVGLICTIMQRLIITSHWIRVMIGLRWTLIGLACIIMIIRLVRGMCEDSV